MVSASNASRKAAYDDLTKGSRFVTTTAKGLNTFLFKGANHAVGRLTLDVYHGVTLGNPFQTGHSRSGWTPLVSERLTGALPRPTDLEIAASVGDRRYRSNLGKARNILRSYRMDKGDIFISNTVPYIGILEFGDSNSPPRAFVRSGILNAIRHFR